MNTHVYVYMIYICIYELIYIYIYEFSFQKYDDGYRQAPGKKIRQTYMKKKSLPITFSTVYPHKELVIMTFVISVINLQFIIYLLQDI